MVSFSVTLIDFDRQRFPSRNLHDYCIFSLKFHPFWISKLIGFFYLYFIYVSIIEKENLWLPDRNVFVMSSFKFLALCFSLSLSENCLDGSNIASRMERIAVLTTETFLNLIFEASQHKKREIELKTKICTVS